MANRSAETPFKEADFRAIIRGHLPTTAAVIAKHSGWAHEAYLYVDITSGPGRYEDGLLGSPLIFQQEAAALGIRYRAWMIEKDRETAALLAAHLSEAPNGCGTHRVFRADHNEQAGAIAAEIARLRGTPFGLVYADDDTLMLPIEALRALAVGRMDLLAYVSATSHKRVSGVYGTPRLMDQLRSLGKRHLWLRQPLTWSKFQATFALLSNWERLPVPGQRFVKVGTREGDALAELLNLPAQVRKELASPRLPLLEIEPIEPTPSTWPTHGSALSELKP